MCLPVLQFYDSMIKLTVCSVGSANKATQLLTEQKIQHKHEFLQNQGPIFALLELKGWGGVGMWGKWSGATWDSTWGLRRGGLWLYYLFHIVWQNDADGRSKCMLPSKK